MSLSDIERNWDVSKILITENANPNYVAFKLGLYGIYTHKATSIITDPQKSTIQLPMIVETRSLRDLDIQTFVLGEEQFKAYKVFKHGEKFFNIEECIGLIANTMKNMLHMFDEPKAFYIDCKSDGLRKRFYEMGVRINTEDGTGHSFDFETYDYRLIIKKYDTYLNDRIGDGYYNGSTVIACLTSEDMPNFWNQEV